MSGEQAIAANMYSAFSEAAEAVYLDTDAPRYWSEMGTAGAVFSGLESFSPISGISIMAMNESQELTEYELLYVHDEDGWALWTATSSGEPLAPVIFDPTPVSAGFQPQYSAGSLRVMQNEAQSFLISSDAGSELHGLLSDVATGLAYRMLANGAMFLDQDAAAVDEVRGNILYMDASAAFQSHSILTGGNVTNRLNTHYLAHDTTYSRIASLQGVADAAAELQESGVQPAGEGCEPLSFEVYGLRVVLPDFVQPGCGRE